MTHTRRITRMLGGTNVLKADISTDAALEEAVLKGIPVQAVRVLAARTSSSLAQLQAIAHIDRSTFARRARARSRLKPDESDRIVRVARIAALAIEAMGTEDGLAWLREPSYALGERIPVDMLGTEVGARQVEDVLLRIQHGVYS